MTQDIYHRGINSITMLLTKRPLRSELLCNVARDRGQCASPLSAEWSHGTVGTFLCLEGPFSQSFPCLSLVYDQLLWASKTNKKTLEVKYIKLSSYMSDGPQSPMIIRVQHDFVQHSYVDMWAGKQKTCREESFIP